MSPLALNLASTRVHIDKVNIYTALPSEANLNLNILSPLAPHCDSYISDPFSQILVTLIFLYSEWVISSSSSGIGSPNLSLLGYVDRPLYLVPNPVSWLEPPEPFAMSHEIEPPV